MRKKLKKVTSLLLSVVMAFSLTPAFSYNGQPIEVYGAANIQTGTCGVDARWEFNTDTGELTISGTGVISDRYSFNREIKAVTINEGITQIGSNVFYNSTIESIMLPSTLESIGYAAFWGCGNLKKLHLPASLETLGMVALENCISLEEISVDKENRFFSSVDGVLYNKNQTELVLYPAGRTAEEFTIPDDVKTLGNYAFDYNQKLKKVTIPSSVMTLGSDTPFIGARAIQSIIVGEDNPAYSSVEGVLHNRDKTELIKYPIGNSNTSYEILSGVESISGDAFSYASALEEIFIPETVAKIQSSALDFCSSLKKVTILNPECEMQYMINTLNEISSEMTICGYSNSTAKNYAIEHSINFEKIDEKEVMSISIASLPKKLKFALNDRLNYYGLTIQVQYADDTSVIRSQGYTVEGFDSTLVGNEALTVSYGGKNVSYDIEIVEQLEKNLVSDGEAKTVDIIERGQECFLYFTPTVSGIYHFYSIDDFDTVGAIYDADFNELIRNDDSEEKNPNFLISYELEADTTYILSAALVDEEALGSFDVVLELYQANEPETTTEEPSTEKGTLAEVSTSEETTSEYVTADATTSTKKITVKKAVIKKVSKKKSAKKINLLIKKIKNITGYEVQVSTSKKFKKILVKKKIKKAKVKLSSKKFKKKKKLFVRVRGYLKKSGKKYTGKWSTVKKVKIEK